MDVDFSAIAASVLVLAVVTWARFNSTGINKSLHAGFVHRMKKFCVKCLAIVKLAILDQNCSLNLCRICPPKLPIIGNLHQLGLFPHCSLGALAQCYGPLMLLHLGKVPVLVVSSADAACEIVRNVIFANQPKLTPFVKLLNGCIYVSMAPYGEYLRKVKSLFVVQLLRNKRIHHSFRDVRVEKYSDQGEVGSKFRKQFKDFIELMTTFHVEDYIPWQGWLCYFNSLNAKLKKTSKEVDDFLEVLVNSKMAENVDEGNENDFKENDNVSPENEILRRNRPFIEYL
ncbi:cytochrome P450 71A21-like [Citrus clementina]|uniref:cytochrome P450 71A21-like n=1 Tax=Citrus clementina TaxID=85681 RepID=UPI000CED6EC7|nr:cytochrome P450 71A21-like [Citrus x clementina]